LIGDGTSASVSSATLAPPSTSADKAARVSPLKDPTKSNPTTAVVVPIRKVGVDDKNTTVQASPAAGTSKVVHENGKVGKKTFPVLNIILRFYIDSFTFLYICLKMTSI